MSPLPSPRFGTGTLGGGVMLTAIRTIEAIHSWQTQWWLSKLLPVKWTGEKCCTGFLLEVSIPAHSILKVYSNWLIIMQSEFRLWHGWCCVSLFLLQGLFQAGSSCYVSKSQPLWVIAPVNKKPVAMFWLLTTSTDYYFEHQRPPASHSFALELLKLLPSC